MITQTRSIFFTIGKNRLARIFFLLALAVSIFLYIYVQNVAGATYTWDGGGGDALWSNDLNWSSNTEPGSSDIAYFDGSCVTNCSPTINATVSVAGLNMVAGYLGTITTSGVTSVTVGQSHFVQAAGTFQGGTGTTTFNGNFTISGGTYVAASSTYFSFFTNNTIDVLTTQTFEAVSFNSTWFGAGGLALATGDTLVALGTVTFITGAVNGPGAIEARGDILTKSGSLEGTAVVDFGNDSLAQTWTVTGGMGPLVRFDSAADASDSVVLTASGGFYGASTTATFSGTIPFVPNSYIMSISDGAWKQAAGTFQGGTGTTTFGDDFIISGGTFLAASSTYFSFHTSDTFDVLTTQTFEAVSFNSTWFGAGGFALSSGDTLVALGTVTFITGAVNGPGTIEARGDVLMKSGIGGTAMLTFSGSSTSGVANQAFDLTGATSIFDADIAVNKSEGRVTLLSALVMNAASQDLLIQSGTLDLAGQDLTVSGAGKTFVVYDGGSVALRGSENLTSPTLLRDGSTVEYNGTSTYASLAATTTTYSNLTFSGSGSWSTSTSLTITGNFTQTAGTFTQTVGTATFSGATSTTLTTTSGTTFGQLAIAKTSATTTLAGSGITTGNLLLSSGTLDASTAGCSSASCGITLAGNWNKTSGTFVPRTGTVTLSGTDQSITGSNSFYNLTKTGSITATLTYEAGTTQTIAGAWTMRGASGGVLSLRSSVPDSYWYVDPQGARSLAYANIKDGNNSNVTAVNASATGNVDAGNNINFDFNPENFFGRFIRIRGGVRLGGSVRL